MSTIIVELYDALREAGVSDEKAKAAAAAVISTETEDRLATKADLGALRLATKTDLAQLEASTKADLAQLEASTKADLAQLEGSIKADLAQLRVTVAQVEGHILRWVVGTIIAMTAVFAGIVKLL
jgi:hypothetical protein